MSRPTSAPAAMPFFGDAYLADTMHLTNEQHGMYLKLLLVAWRQPSCSLPDDDQTFARICGVGLKKWKSERATLLEFWDLDPHGRWVQKKQLEVRAWTAEASERGRAAANARWQKDDERQQNLDLNASRKSQTTPSSESTPGNCNDCGKPLKLPKRADTTAHATRARGIQSGICKCNASQTQTHKKEGGRKRVRTPARARATYDSLKIIREWNALADAHDLPHVATLTEKRRTSIRARIDDYGEARIIEAIRMIANRPWLLGENERHWKANFDFLVRPNTVARIIEGDFQRSANGKSANGSDRIRDPLLRS